MDKFQLIFFGARIDVVAILSACGFFFAGCSAPTRAAPLLEHKIIATLPHDSLNFTQGLLIDDGELFESTGQFGASSLQRRTIASGALKQRRALPPDQFGEGLARVESRFIQLTWTSGVAWLYDLALKPVGQLRYDGEGWGLAYDGRHLLMSDGSARITRRDPATFGKLASIEVRDGDTPVRHLNELEFANGWLYANVWRSDRIAVIDPVSGAVRGWHDLSALKRGFEKPAGWRPDEHVLNGIAWNPANRHFYVTGKYWPVLFEMEFVQPAAGTATPQ